MNVNKKNRQNIPNISKYTQGAEEEVIALGLLQIYRVGQITTEACVFNCLHLHNAWTNLDDFGTRQWRVIDD